MPTHGSPAAARQANARARPRAGVSRPAHRPRPAQPSAPAPVLDPALTPPQNPDSYPHISPPPFTWGRCLPLQRPPSAAPRDLCKCQSGHVPGLAPQRCSRPCICCPPPHRVLLGSGWQGRLPVPTLVAGSQAACSCPGVPSGSLLSWAFSLRFGVYCLPPQGPPPEATPSSLPRDMLAMLSCAGLPAPIALRNGPVLCLACPYLSSLLDCQPHELRTLKPEGDLSGR